MIPTLLISNVASVASQRASTMDPLDALGVPGNAAYTAAYSLYSLPTSLVVVSIVTAIFTRMATKASDGDLAGVRDDTSRAMRIVAVFTFLATALILVLAIPAIRIISPGSSWEEVASIGTVLWTMSLGLVGVGSFTVLQRVYYALEDAKGLFFIQIPFFVLHSALILSTVLLPARLIVAGVGISMAITNTATCLAALVQLRRRLGGIDGARLVSTFARLTGAAALATIVGFGILRLFGPLDSPFSASGAVIRILIISAAMTAVFLGTMKALRMSELEALLAPLRAIVRRLRPQGAAQEITLNRNDSSLTDGVNVSLNLETGRRLRDRYELIEAMGSPENIAVWRGVDTVLGADVRLLIIPADSPTREATVDAARRGVLVDDVRLIKFLSIFDLDGSSVIVTELPSGATLRDYMSSGPVSEAQARAIIGETAGAVDAGVRRGVRHLTLRDELVYVDKNGSVLVDGLGVDAALKGEHPEDLDPRELDRRDIENLSTLLASLLLGEEAPTGDSTDFLERAAAESSSPEITELLHAVSNGEGPRTTTDFIRALAPWGAVQVSMLPAPAATLDETQAIPAIPDPFEEPAPETASQKTATAAPIVAPAPAAWPKRSPADSESPNDSWTALGTDDYDDEPRNSRASAILIGVVAVLVLIVGFVAARYLMSDTRPVTLNNDETTPPVVEDEDPDTDTDTEPEEPEETETTEEPVDYPEPAISSITLLNPQAANLDPTTVDSQDNPGSIPNLYDGNPGTSWSSWWYSDQGFWMKDGIGLEITLAEETEISDVVLNVDGSGGLVQWRDTVSAAPNSGQVTAEGAMSAETVLSSPEPVVTQTVILWFEDLPVANSDGQFRIDISEITVR